MKSKATTVMAYLASLPADAALDVIGEAIRRTPAKAYVATYVKTLASTGRGPDGKKVKTGAAATKVTKKKATAKKAATKVAKKATKKRSARVAR